MKGPFSHPERIPDGLAKMNDCATIEDYESGELKIADPYKEFMNQFRNDTSVEFVELKRRIVNGRSIHM